MSSIHVNNHTLVVKFNESLIKQFDNTNFIIITDSFDNINYIFNFVSESNNLECILIQSEQDLSSILFSDDWNDIPLNIFANKVGDYKELFIKLDIIRKLNIKLYLSSLFETNYTDIQILSSLHLHTGIFFQNNVVYWENFKDLMYYFLFSKTHHAPIDPFELMVRKYDYNTLFDLSYLYFDDPKKYIYLDENFNIFLSHSELCESKSISNGIENLKNIENNKAYNDRITKWQNYFISLRFCSSCPAWRICGGKFDEGNKGDYECSVILTEFLNTIEDKMIKSKM